ncbi:unnamed protein product [Echinostoma caproni]|uniref:Protein HID1 n=1 Tax=Echinostoma caproni TaxID=27848 RepID=A0A183BEW1_9TREM|nr:unnamed protein product [Echinostoma caproni]
MKPNGNGASSGPRTFQATLAETPAVRNMTDPQLANAHSHMQSDPAHPNPETLSDPVLLNGTQQTTLDDAPLVSNFSPTRHSRTGSNASDRSSTTPGQTEHSDHAPSVPLHHPGIGSSSLLQQESNSSTVKSTSHKKSSLRTAPHSDSGSTVELRNSSAGSDHTVVQSELNTMDSPTANWSPTPEWAMGWKAKMPFQTIMRLLQVLVPQVEKICIDKGLTDESEIVKFLQNGTLVGLLPVPHPILIRKYQSNSGTAIWFRNYLWGVIYLR